MIEAAARNKQNKLYKYFYKKRKKNKQTKLGFLWPKALMTARKKGSELNDIAILSNKQNDHKQETSLVISSLP